MSSVDDAPKSVMMQKLATAKDKPTAFHRMVSEMLSKHIDLLIRPESTSSRGDDGVLSYAEEVLTLSLLWAEFQDAIQEGDGMRVFLLLVFKASHRKNYSIEALTLLVQYERKKGLGPD